jgi:hypothetical protein
VLTWRYCRHEGTFRYRSLDLKEATAVACYAVVQNGTQGTYHIRIVLWSFITIHPHAPSLPNFPFRVTALPLFPSLASESLRNPMSGKRGSGHMQVCWHVTRGQNAHPFCLCATAHCVLTNKFVNTPCFGISTFFASLTLFSDVLTNIEQVNNVIIAGSDENDF